MTVRMRTAIIVPVFAALVGCKPAETAKTTEAPAAQDQVNNGFTRYTSSLQQDVQKAQSAAAAANRANDRTERAVGESGD